MIKAFILTVLFTVLAGCATQSIQPVTDASHERWSQRQQLLSSIHSWDIRGRIAIFFKEEVHNLGFGWKRQLDHSSIKLEAPLNQGMLQLVSSPEEVLLTTSEGETVHGENAEQILTMTTGWTIPVQGLNSWIFGINHSASKHTPNIDGEGRALSIEQDDWTINYLSYDDSPLAETQNMQLPKKIYMKRDDLALKIVIDQWQPAVTSTHPDIFPQFPR